MGGDYKLLKKEKVLSWYSREDVQDIICAEAKDKEVAMMFDYNGKYGYGKRPDTILNPADVYELAKQGATSFHFSEELWQDPLQITSDNLNELRKGWDLIIDIDTPYFPYSKIAAYLIVEALKHHGIKPTCKFSGNHGFHLCVPFEAFPKHFQEKETRLLFPEGPRRIALYLKEMIREHLAKRLLEHDVNTIAKNIEKKVEEIYKNEFDPFEVVDIDTILISSRHLCRMPYSFNEKSGLVSISIDTEEIMKFEREYAKPENVKEVKPFIKRDVDYDASSLIVQAFDFKPNIKQDEIKKEIEYEEIKDAVPEELFPPCIKKILEGMEDGRKRGLFILINFLSHVGWSHEMIQQKIDEWNKENKKPLKEVYIKGQLNYAKKSKKLPPNCNNEMYYKGLNICFPDNLCNKIKNPVNYSRRKAFAGQNNKKKKDKNP